jgi:hypothetical protein
MRPRSCAPVFGILMVVLCRILLLTLILELSLLKQEIGSICFDTTQRSAGVVWATCTARRLTKIIFPFLLVNQLNSGAFLLALACYMVLRFDPLIVHVL